MYWTSRIVFVVVVTLCVTCCFCVLVIRVDSLPSIESWLELGDTPSEWPLEWILYPPPELDPWDFWLALSPPIMYWGIFPSLRRELNFFESLVRVEVLAFLLSVEYLLSKYVQTVLCCIRGIFSTGPRFWGRSITEHHFVNFINSGYSPLPWGYISHGVQRSGSRTVAPFATVLISLISQAFPVCACRALVMTLIWPPTARGLCHPGPI